MQIVVVANGPVRAEFTGKEIKENAKVDFVNSLGEVQHVPDAIFYLSNEESLLVEIGTLQRFDCPVIVHSVVHTLKELNNEFIRINAWPGFLKRDIVEVAAGGNNLDTVQNIFDGIGWKYQLVADVAGMIAARIIAMIINEAWFALGDKVSSKHDIDTAMKLGTNYPYGPFEWGEKIGLQNILHLLNNLAVSDKRYTPAPLLINETR